MKEAALRCVWEALAMGEERAVKNMDLSAFDWHSAHPVFGSPLHAILFGKLIVSADEESDTNELNNGFDDLINADYSERKSRLALLRFAMRCGADPHIVAPKQCDVSRWWGGERGGDNMKPISFAGRSAFECLLAAKRSIKLRHQDPTDDADWTDELKAVDEAVDILSRPSCTANMLAVVEDVVATWEAALADNSSADVTLRVLPGGAEGAGGGGGGLSAGSGAAGAAGAEDQEHHGAAVEVRAHSAVLRGASSVLKAMLSQQGMREGAHRVIEVVGSSASAVRLLLSLVYTGGAGASGAGGAEEEEPGTATILAALDLAHRWQLLHVVQLLAGAAARRVDSETFEAAAEAALRLELPALLAACRSHAAAHARELRGRLCGRGGAAPLRSAAVRADVEKLLACEAPCPDSVVPAPAAKRRRRTL